MADLSRPERVLRDFLATHLPGAGVNGLVVGLSGGLDSCVLLSALARVAPEFALPLRAVHVHHGLSPNADAWAAQVATVCAQAGVPLTVCRVRVTPQASLESAARVARHSAFAAEVRAGEALLLAQHRDDQAETLLFRLLRGSGLTGLGAMRPASRLRRPTAGSFPAWRPLLGLARTDLLGHAQAQGLAWVEDESNADTGLDRNFLRHEILPRLATRWPALSRTLAATAARLQEADDLLDEFALELAAPCIDAEARLWLPAVMALTVPRQRLVLRHWLRTQGFLPPDAAVLERILADALPARPDASPCVAWPGTEVRRYREHLYVMTTLPAPPGGWFCTWDGAAPLALPDGQWLWREGEGAPAAPWRVAYRAGGERLRPAPGLPSRELRIWWQEQGVPPWRRERLPLVFTGDELIAVGDMPWPGQPRPWRLRMGERPG